MHFRTWFATCIAVCCLVMVAASMTTSAPYLIYDQAGFGGGNIYYGGGVFDGTFYTGQISQCAQQWRDEQINGSALMNYTPPGYVIPGEPANIAKASLPLGGYIYMSNGGGTLCRSDNWASNPIKINTPIISECICTDGTHIFMTSGTSSDYNKVHKWIVNHAAGTVTEAAGWPISIASTATVRFRGVSYYNGKLYLVNHKKTGEIYEVDAQTGASSQIAAIPTAADSGYQAVRYGDKIFVVGLDSNLYTLSLSGTTWTLASTDNLNSVLGDTDCYGIAVKGDGTEAKYAWVTHLPSRVSFWDLAPYSAPGSVADARKAKNGYPVAIANAVVTMVGMDGFWVEDKNRSAGLHVVWGGQLPEINATVSLNGSLGVSESGEKFMTPASVDAPGDTFNIRPLFLTNKSMGPATGSAGLANDGLLVTIYGRVNSYDEAKGAIYIDDGSGVASDVAPVTGVKVVTQSWWDVPGFFDMTSGTPPYPYFAVATGVVRLEKLADGTIIRKIEARSGADIVLTQLPL